MVEVMELEGRAVGSETSISEGIVVCAIAVESVGRASVSWFCLPIAPRKPCVRAWLQKQQRRLLEVT